MKPRLLPLLAVLLAGPLQSQLVPETSQHRVDSGRDRVPANVAVSMAPDGSHTAVWTYWQDYGSFMCTPTAIYARRFDREGQPMGAPFAAARSEQHCIEGLRIGPPVDGRRLLVWEEVYGKYGSFGYTVSALGPSGRAKRLKKFDGATTAAVIPLRSGGFLAVSRRPKGEGIQFWGRRFDAAARPLGRGFNIMAGGKAYTSVADATETAGGGLAIVWVEHDFDTELSILRARALRADGRPLSGVFEVSRNVIGLRRPRIERDDSGRFAIVWSASDLQVSPLFSVLLGRFYEADGTARTPVLSLIPTLDKVRFLQDAAMGAEGELVPVWRFGFDQDDNGAGLVDAAGQPLDVIEPLTDRPEGYQQDSAVATNRHGLWVVAWTWMGEGSEGPGVYTRLFTSQP
jgi:hypothetical protein